MQPSITRLQKVPVNEFHLMPTQWSLHASKAAIGQLLDCLCLLLDLISKVFEVVKVWHRALQPPSRASTRLQSIINAPSVCHWTRLGLRPSRNALFRTSRGR
jgi:hypothetical protein